MNLSDRNVLKDEFDKINKSVEYLQKLILQSQSLSENENKNEKSLHNDQNVDNYTDKSLDKSNDSQNIDILNQSVSKLKSIVESISFSNDENLTDSNQSLNKTIEINPRINISNAIKVNSSVYEILSSFYNV